MIIIDLDVCEGATLFASWRRHMALIQKVKDEEERKKKAEPTPANGAATSSPHDSRISSADPIIARGNTDYNMQRYLPTDDALKREIEAYGDQPRDTYDQATETEGLLDGYSKYSNDVDFGEKPIFLGGTENLSADEGATGSGGGLGDRGARETQSRDGSLQRSLPSPEVLSREIAADRMGGRY